MGRSCDKWLYFVVAEVRRLSHSSSEGVIRFVVEAGEVKSSMIPKNSLLLLELLAMYSDRAFLVSLIW